MYQQDHTPDAFYKGTHDELVQELLKTWLKAPCDATIGLDHEGDLVVRSSRSDSSDLFYIFQEEDSFYGVTNSINSLRGIVSIDEDEKTFTFMDEDTWHMLDNVLDRYQTPREWLHGEDWEKWKAFLSDQGYNDYDETDDPEISDELDMAENSLFESFCKKEFTKKLTREEMLVKIDNDIGSRSTILTLDNQGNYGMTTDNQITHGTEFEYTLLREGNLPLLFNGDWLELDHLHPTDHRGNETKRWYSFSTYQTDSGLLVASVEYHSLHSSERTKYYAEFDKDPSVLWQKMVDAVGFYDEDAKDRLTKIFIKSKWQIGQQI